MSQPETTTTDREILSTRLLDAPRELVWQVWTDPAHLRLWWGPEGFDNAFEIHDFRPGGEWRFQMLGPDGTVHPNRIVFREIEPPARLVFDLVSGPRFTVTVTFEDQGGRTALGFRMVFATPEELDAVKGFAVEGNRQTLARFADEVALAKGRTFELTRTFEAPRELVWKVWTEAEHLARWWGPKELSGLRVAELDLRPGGRFHYAMAAPDGTEMWGKFLYRDVVPGRRLVYLVAFSDAAGGTTRHPMAPDWPLEMLNAVTFEDAGEGRTRLRLQGVAFQASEAEAKAFEAGFPSMQQGFTGTLDQLEAYLAGQR